MVVNPHKVSDEQAREISRVLRQRIALLKAACRWAWRNLAHSC